MNNTMQSDSITAIPAEIFDRLAQFAPSVSFTVSRDIDHGFVWDGDGEDPCKNGFDAYNVTVTARVIVGRQIVEGRNSLGGSYFLPDEPTGEIHGYLLQMLAGAAEDLCDTLSQRGLYCGERLEQLANVRCYVRQAMRAAYDAQMAGRV